MQKNCIKCEDNLIPSLNWTESRKRKKHYVCKPCFNTSFKERKEYKAARKTDRTNLKLGKKLSRKITNFIQDTIKRNKTLELSFKEISEIMQKPCHYCGYDKDNVGLDRIDSSIGYSKNNVVPCCASCNYGKHTLSSEDYINHCKKVIKYQEKIDG